MDDTGFNYRSRERQADRVFMLWLICFALAVGIAMAVGTYPGT